MKKAPLFILLFLTACISYVHRQQEVQDAMQHYDRLIKKMDADSIALLYTEDGDLGGIAHGRDSIRRYLTDEQYRLYNRDRPTPFLDWVDRVYDPAAVKASFMSQWWANLVVDKILRRE